MPITNTMSFINIIEMCVYLNYMNWFLIFKSIDTRDINRMITSYYNRYCFSCQYLFNCKFYVRMTFYSVCMNNVSITNINNTSCIFLKINNIIFKIINEIIITSSTANSADVFFRQFRTSRQSIQYQLFIIEDVQLFQFDFDFVVNCVASVNFFSAILKLLFTRLIMSR